MSALLKIPVNSFIPISEPLYCYYMNTDSASTMMRKAEYTKIVIACDELFGSLAEILKGLSGAPVYPVYEYQFIFHYYSCIYASCIDYSYKNKIRAYKALNGVIKKYMPNYLQNKNIAFFRDNSDMTRFKRKVWLSSRFEKVDAFMHNHFLMSTLLLIYHICYIIGIYKAKR